MMTMMTQQNSSPLDPISIGLGVGGLASNIFTNIANQSNNDRNYELAKRQQDFAERSFRQQMRFNSPVTQASLLRAGGLNPALMNSGLAGSISAGSSGGSPSNTPIQPLDISGLNGLASNISLIDSQKKKNDAEAVNTSTLTETSLMKRNIELSKLLADTKLTDEQRKYYQSQKDFTEKLLKFQDEKSEWENHNLRLDVLNKSLQNEALTIQNSFLPTLTDLQCKELISTIYLNYVTGKMNGESAAKIKQETINEVIRSGILGNDFYKGAVDGLKGKTLFEALKKHPKMRRFESAVDVVLNRFEHLPVNLFMGIK